MKLDARAIVPPIVALLILVLVLQQTLAALRVSGSWQAQSRNPQARAEDPYARLDLLLSRPLLDASELRRDPFGYSLGAPTPSSSGTTAFQPAEARPAPLPVLTSIIWDNDPRATVRYDGRDFSVRENTLFADFRVISIAETQVVLERNRETLVLTLQAKGE